MLPGARGISEGIIAYKHTSHSSNIKAMKLVCNSNIVIFSQFDIIIKSFEMKWQQTYRGQVLMLDG
jgi:hypothetical protein